MGLTNIEIEDNIHTIEEGFTILKQTGKKRGRPKKSNTNIILLLILPIFLFSACSPVTDGDKAFPHDACEIIFFENWKGNQYDEVLAKSILISSIILVIGLCIYAGASTDTKGSNPQPL